jgi:hypothetical protein
MPGTVVSTTATLGAGAQLSQASSRYMVTGITERGRTSVITLGSLADYVAEFGGNVAYSPLYRDIECAFGEGATEVLVRRVVGPAATVGTLTLLDRAGTALATIKVDASGPGAWSSDLTIQIVNGDLPNSWSMLVAYRAGQADEIRETFANLGTNIVEAVNAVNERSRLVKLTNQASATVAPANIPAVLAATALSAGTDDRASVTAAVKTTALADFIADLGPASVAVPGENAATIAPAVIAHCAANRRVGILTGAVSDSSATIQSTADTIRALAGSQYVLLAWPWVKVSDGVGGLVEIPATGFVAGARARVIEAKGPWAPAAGKAGEGRTIRETVTPVNKALSDTLNAKGVTAIRVIQGSVRIYDWRAVTPSSNVLYYSLSDVDVLNALAWDCLLIAEDVVFTPIDARGLGAAELGGRLEGVCNRYLAADGLYPLNDDKGFKVEVLPNPALRRYDASVTVRTSQYAEQVVLVVGRVPVTAQL